MRFTSSAISAILAFGSIASAAPALNGRQAPSPAYSGLDATAQLTLSDTYTILSNDADFVFDFNAPQKNAGAGGQIGLANRKTFPAVVGLGTSMAVGRLNGCAINTLHVHPRATELLIVVEGSIVSQMIPENGVVNADGSPRVITANLTALQMTPLPMGSIHAQYNPNCEPAVFVSALNSEDPGVNQAAPAIFATDPDSVSATLGFTIDAADVDTIKMAIPPSVIAGVEACLSKCGIKKRSAQ